MSRLWVSGSQTLFQSAVRHYSYHKNSNKFRFLLLDSLVRQVATSLSDAADITQGNVYVCEATINDLSVQITLIDI